MVDSVLLLLGGIGLYLFGMQVMTDALRQLASRSIRNLLARFTRSPLSGAMIGAGVTALIQSSSATMLTTIGFVGAGLITFPQAIGIIYGANIGTTVTGWMVMALGLKLHLGTLALPLMLSGALVRALGRARLARVGLLILGFSLLFLGLDYMQRGTEGIDMMPLFRQMPADTWLGRGVLVLTGAVFTVVVQASSAGVAMALVLLGAGTLSLPQAAALVIGMDIGSTVKSLLATIGGSRDMRRTAVAHVAYNVVTGLAAFLLLGVVTAALVRLTGDPLSALVSFHTLLNVIGVMLLLPFTGPFARLVERLVPDDGALASLRLDRALLSDADAALDAARGASDTVAAALFAALGARLGPTHDAERLVALAPRLEAATAQIEDFLTGIEIEGGKPGPLRRHAALLHQFDHISRLAARADQQSRIALVLENPRLARPALVLGAVLRQAAKDMADPTVHGRLNRLAELVARRAARLRHTVMLRDRVGPVSGPGVFDLTDAMRWLERATRHAERIVHYGIRAAEPDPAAGSAPDPWFMDMD